MTLFFFDDGTIPFDGITPLWKWLGGLEGRRIYLKNAFLSYVDCFHYSCVSITTLGYGDMLPTKWYTKLLTDIEVILGMGVAIVGLGRFFSNNGQSKKMPNQANSADAKSRAAD